MYKIELITNYFPPEMGAAASRMYNLAKGLKDFGHDVEVIAPMPNYPEERVYEGYRNKFRVFESIEEIKVRRYWILPSFMSQTIFRILGMISFPVTLWLNFFHLWKRKPDVIIIQNTPLLVSFSALILSKLLPDCNKVLNVSDLWPLSAADLGFINKEQRKYKVMEWLELYNYKSADLIVGQSKEIIEYIGRKVDKPFFLYRNISPKYHDPDKFIMKYPGSNLKIIYAGLLSSFQGVFDICREINFQKIGAEFHIYGSGEEEGKIIEYVENYPHKNIHFHGRVTKEHLLQILPEYHASIVPLANRIYGAVPSKIFELISLGVPVLLCGSGEGAELIKENELGYTSEPNDYRGLEKNLKELKKLTRPSYKRLLVNCKRFAEKELNFEEQLNRFIDELKDLIN